MPATLIDEPLGIACVFSDGSTAKFGLAVSTAVQCGPSMGGRNRTHPGWY
jgi:hypothetical protein